MNTLIAGLGGATAGAGLYWTVYTLRRPTLAELLPPAEREPVRPGAAGPLKAVRAAGAGVLARLGWPGERTRRDLAACESDVDVHRMDTSVAAVLGLALGVFPLAAATPPASPLPVLSALTLGACLLALSLCAPTLILRHRAARHRARLSAATSVVADLVGVALAGGAGVTGALTSATRQGDGPAFTRIRLCLHEANLRTRPPWEALADLAHHTGVRDLDELASSVRLAGTDGARVRASVRSKAASLRTHRLAALEGEAHQATERMTLPVMLLVLGFLLLMGYPAIVHVTNGF
ncbi:type II secretion system F family protein [Nocardiopsis sp. NPDC058631]|uniref:type II secretion system F family protein n=1 Tax=Nocardiopsis sp. NPDC058631 TaxID=3346566 RepID=UPI00364DF34A